MYKYITLIYLFLLCCNISFAQTLNISPRNPTAQNGTQIIGSITNLSLENRESYILSEVLNGNIPDFYRNMLSITDSALIGSVYKHITYYVIPDYLALGCDSNYFLCPMTPILGQIVADTLNCILPTRKMVDRIWSAAVVKMQPSSIPPSSQMTTVPVFAQHNSTVWTQRQTFFPGNPLGNLVSGNKKDVVISNLIYSSPAPERVVIYGWHYPSGVNIQPLYAGHIDTYADYSHGIRLIQNEVYVDGDTMLATEVLKSATLNSLLSDEGQMSLPFYPDTSLSSTVSIPVVPKSFCIVNETATSVRIILSNNSNVDDYQLYTSVDGLNFNGPTPYSSDNFVHSGLSSNVITYFRIAASNSAGTSANSEVLAAVPSSSPHELVIINGFDRNSTGNTYNFIRQHAEAILNYNYSFSSATNEAVLNGLINLNNFSVADYILGEESTVDETFSSTEQNLVKSYLDNGGFLFVSGAEIGWDLDYSGSFSDKDFYNNYLKAQYISDAPNNQSATYYEFEETANPVFSGMGTTFFDDGNNGTYDVNYPDVIEGINGGINGLEYSNLTNNTAGVYFKGLFPNASDTGKIVNLGFPFETVYPESKRFSLMQKVLDFFADTSGFVLPLDFVDNKAVRIYPNPFSDIITVDFIENNYSETEISIIGLLGRTVYNQPVNQKKTCINVCSFASGIYFVTIRYKAGFRSFKIVKD
jgi:hypothetical protein